MNPGPAITTSIDDTTLAGPFHAVQRAEPSQLDPPTPLVFSSPHSGRLYPPDFGSCLAGLDVRRSEDAFVDKLVEMAPQWGAALILAQAGRAYLDVNREAYELDPGMFTEPLPVFVNDQSPRVIAGLGAVARVIHEGLDIYARKLTFAEAQRRIDTVHKPYHQALAALISDAKAKHGFAILIDWHSMPSAAGQSMEASETCDIVLGDRYGAACHPALTDRVERELSALGYSVGRNMPFAGGYITQHYGRPQAQVHALQIEIRRSLYLDEDCLELTEGYKRLRADFARLTEVLAAEVWEQFRP